MQFIQVLTKLFLACYSSIINVFRLEMKTADVRPLLHIDRKCPPSSPAAAAAKGSCEHRRRRADRRQVGHPTGVELVLADSYLCHMSNSCFK